MSLTEDRLRRIAEETTVDVPPVSGVMSRGRRIRRRRRACIGSLTVVMLAGAALALPDEWSPVQLVAGGPSLTAAPHGGECQIVGRDAEPTVADGMRLMPSASVIPPGMRQWFARAGEGTGCPKAATPLVLVHYGDDGRTVRQTLVVSGPGADSFALGDRTGSVRVRGTTAAAYGPPDSPYQAFIWTEHGLRYRVDASGMPRDQVLRIVEALRVDPAADTVSLPADLAARYTTGRSAPAFPGTDWVPGWTAAYTGPRPNTEHIFVTANPIHTSFDALLRKGMRITTVRGHRAAYRANTKQPPDSASLMWEERPGVLVTVSAEGFSEKLPDLADIAESLRPVPADDPRITD